MHQEELKTSQISNNSDECIIEISISNDRENAVSKYI